MPIINRIAEFHAEMTAWRQDFHRHPELSLEEVRTSAIVQEKLRASGVDEVITGYFGVLSRFSYHCASIVLGNSIAK